MHKLYLAPPFFVYLVICSLLYIWLFAPFGYLYIWLYLVILQGAFLWKSKLSRKECPSALWLILPLGFFIFFFFNVYLFLRGSEWAGEGQTEGRTEDPKHALCWQQRAQRRAQPHKLWDHDLTWSWTLNWLSHPGAPGFFFFSFFTRPLGLGGDSCGVGCSMQGRPG